jgi:hypothetical protein
VQCASILRTLLQVMREAQLTHHLQQSDGAMRINTQNPVAGDA